MWQAYTAGRWQSYELASSAACARTCSGAELTITNSELAREKMWARIYITPALQAEEDRDQVRRYLADQAREKELMGSATRAYNSDRCVILFLSPLKFALLSTMFQSEIPI